MALPTFVDIEVNKYVKLISINDLSILTTDLRSDFDNAIFNRFKTNQTQEATIASTPGSFKMVIASAFEWLYQLRLNGSKANMTIIGIQVNGDGAGLQDKPLLFTVKHNPDCSWEIGISLKY